MYGPATPRTDFSPRQLAPALLASLTVAALGADSGGYDPPTWSWTSVVLLLVAGVVLAVGARRLAPLEWALPVLLVGLVLWTSLSLVWSADVSETVHEVERTLLYVVGVSTLLLLGRRSRVEGLVGALAVAITSVCCYSLVTRLFTPGRGTYQVVSVDPDAAFRLSRPLGYANALALFAVLGILLAFGFALRGRTMVPRALGSAALVVLFPTLYFTYGRGAWLALAGGLVALLALERSRARMLARLLALGVAPVIAVFVASRTHGLTRDPGSVAAATRDGHRLAIAIALLLVLSALVPAGLERAEHRLSFNAPLRRTIVALLALMVAAALALGLVRVGGPAAAVRRAYHAFNAPAPLVQTDASQRLFSLSGNSRSEYWRVGWLEFERHPWLGGGAGSYQRFWLRDRRAALPVRDAHSLYLETLAELGPVGLLLLLCALGTPFVAARAARVQPLAPAILGAYVAFALHAGIDWDWEMPAVTLAAFFCGAALLLAARGTETPPLRRPWRVLGVTVAASVCALSILGFAGNRAAAQGSEALDRSDLHTAEVEARRARRWEPWAAEPWRLLGEAQLEAGEVGRAQASFVHGLDKDRGNWELWLDLVLASEGAERQDALAHVRLLNPLSQELREVQGSP